MRKHKRICSKGVLVGLFLQSFFSVSLLAQSKSTIMFYNAYNLFDAQKDVGKNDWEFLPKNAKGKVEACKKITNPSRRKACLNSNWTNDHYVLKVKQMVRAITSNGTKPAPLVLGLCEVENARTVAAMAKMLGYGNNYIVTESPDKRGIDVALLFRQSKTFKVIRYEKHRLVHSSITRPTRDILEVEFDVAGERLILFVNHWPSQASPNSLPRVAAARLLRKISEKRMQENPNVSIVATGDFNVIPSDSPNPFTDELLKPSKPQWILADVHSMFMRSRRVSRNLKRFTPPGTYYYTRKEIWNLFDRFFINRTMMDGKGIDLNLESYRIRYERFLLRPWKNTKTGKDVLIPWRTDRRSLDPKTAGFTDHLGIQIDLVWKK